MGGQRTFLAIGLAFVLTCSAAFAHQGATGVVKIRMDAMGAIGNNMKSIAQMLTGKTAFDKAIPRTKAGEIAALAKKFPDHFAKKTIDKPSEASPAIWKSPDKFRQISNDLADHAESFASLVMKASSSADLEQEFAKMGDTCKQCHEAFRVKN